MRGQPSRSVLGVVVFTDIVGSTAIADELGDRRWRELLTRHIAIARRELKRFGGREIDTAGDGFFAFFPRAGEAIRWADAVGTRSRDLGIEIRAGVHAGESEVLGRKVSGMTVHIGARVLSVSGAGEILVTSTLKETIPGAGIVFVDHGLHQLKGVPGEWHLYRVSAIDGRPRESPPSEEDARQRRDAVQVPPLHRRAGALVAAGAALVVVATVAFLATSGDGDPDALNSPAATATTTSQLILEIDPRSTSSMRTIALPGHPTGVAWGADTVWATLGPEGLVVRLDPRSGRVRNTYRVNTGASAVAADDEAAWVVGSSGAVARIDAASGRVETISVGGRLEAVAVGADTVWVATSEGAVTRIDPVGRRIVVSVDLGLIEHDIRRVGLAAAQDGVWVNTSGSRGTESNSIAWHVTSAGGVDGGIVMLGGTAGAIGPAGIALAGDRLWAVDFGSDHLDLLDPRAREMPAEYLGRQGLGSFGILKSVAVGFGNRPGYVVVDEAGDPWVLNMFRRSVSHISWFDSSVVETVDVGREPTGVAAGGGRIWVAVSHP